MVKTKSGCKNGGSCENFRNLIFILIFLYICFFFLRYKFFFEIYIFKYINNFFYIYIKDKIATMSPSLSIVQGATMWLQNFAIIAKLQGCEIYSETPYCRNLTQTAKINTRKKFKNA